jgi:LysM repeat protein
MHKHTRHWQRLVGCFLLLLAVAGCYQAAGTGESGPTPISQALPSATPLPTDTPPPLPTDTPTIEPTLEGNSLGQGGALSTPLQPENIIVPTSTSVEILQAPTINPLDPLGATATTNALLLSEPLYVTATAIVLNATQTAAAQLTPAGFFTTVPTFTPVGQPVSGATSAPPLPGADCIHEVRAEDRNLYRISLRYGVTVQDIAVASGITNINLITIGQRLTIPRCGTTGVTPPPTSTLPATSTPLGTRVPGAPANNTPVPATGGRVHVVQQGETLYEISLRYGVPVADIAAANGIANINLIYLGQELVIP